MSLSPLIAFQAIANGDMSQSQLISKPIKIDQQSLVSIQAFWTGTPTGTFDFQICISVDPSIASNNQKWSSVLVQAPIAANGVADDAYVQLNPIGASWFRIVYNKTSGTGSLNAWVCAK